MYPLPHVNGQNIVGINNYNNVIVLMKYLCCNTNIQDVVF